MGNMSVIQLAAQVRLLLMDVDGVLTDARLYNLPDANGNMIETKGFDAQDGIALQWLSWMGTAAINHERCVFHCRAPVSKTQLPDAPLSGINAKTTSARWRLHVKVTEYSTESVRRCRPWAKKR